MNYMYIPELYEFYEDEEEREDEGFKPDEIRTDIDVSEVTKSLCETHGYVEE